MSTELIFLILTGVLVSFVALVVGVSRRINPSVKALFTVTCISLVLWQTTIFIADSVTTNLTYWNNLVFVWPVIAIAAIFLFVLSIGQHAGEKALRQVISVNKNAVFLMSSLAILQVVLILSGQIFTSVTYDPGANSYTFHRGAAYPVYLVFLFAQLVLVGFHLLRNLLRSKYTSIERRALRIILATILLVSSFAVMTNVIIPLLFDSQQYIAYGILSIDIFALGFAYSIIRYKFLDIRLYAFRASIYILVAFMAAAAYAALTSLVVTNLMHVKITGAALFVLSALTVVIAVSFRPLSMFFNRLTSRLFLRDYYEPQDVVDKTTTLLVQTVNLKEIIQKSTEIIASTIKPSTMQYLLRHSHTKEQKSLLSALEKSSMSVIVTDDLEVPQHEHLLKILRLNEVALALRLDTTRDNIGFMLLGPRRSGAAYSISDRRLLRALADSIALGIQNALRFEEIENFNNTLQQKIDEKTKSLQLANQKLRQLDETKDDFISMASHQLRTPLTSIKGYISMVLDGDAGKITPMERKLLGQAFISSQRMVYLISDLLNVSRLRTGKFIIEPMPTNLSNIINEEVRQLQETAKGRGLELTFDKPASFETYMLDETKMRQVIMNFIDNAIYYTPSGGKIEVKLLNKPESIELTVTDTGIGVPKGEQHKLFTKFYRAHNAKRARPDGTGLGLFMAKKVIVAQGGAVLVKSKEGKGSTFGFTFAKSKLEQVPSDR